MFFYSFGKLLDDVWVMVVSDMYVLGYVIWLW